jgi:hypothetical protein
LDGGMWPRTWRCYFERRLIMAGYPIPWYLQA